MKKTKALQPKISLIIPAYNEEKYLARLLNTVEQARSRYVGGKDAIEIIVVDNASTDLTQAIARSYGCRVFREEKRVIGAVRNRGARAAAGKILAFVDADSQLHPETFNRIDQALFRGKAIAGATGVTLERKTLGIAAAYLMLVPLVWLTGMDTGVVFCLRQNFEAVDGYSENLLFAEDVDFLWKMKRRGRACGQKLVRLKAAKAVASTRKFDTYGDWHYVWMILRMLFWMAFSRQSAESFAHCYWYGNQR